jgi:P27 family predicted phage terminase small subunit
MPAGRPAKPSALKLVEGNRGKRAGNHHEPDPDYVEDLTPPEWLAPDVAEVWGQLAPQLRRARLLTTVDLHALEMGCVAIAMYRRATAEAARSSFVIASAKEGQGAEYDEQDAPASPAGGSINPWLIVQSMAFKQAATILREFGATPAARSRVAINPQGSLFTDPAAAYFA